LYFNELLIDSIEQLVPSSNMVEEEITRVGLVIQCTRVVATYISAVTASTSQNTLAINRLLALQYRISEIGLTVTLNRAIDTSLQV
jgi:hypothetical protein